MDNLLKNAFKLQIENKKESDFEDFIDELFLLKYGADNYIPIRRVRDNGNDGTILSEQKILACYAPKKYNEADFVTKVVGSASKKGDFPKYTEKWREKFPNWEMYVNHEIAPAQLKLILDLDGNTSIKGVSQILAIIEDMVSSKKRKLASFLGIEQFFIQDYVRDIVDDLLNSPVTENQSIYFNKQILIPPQRKIELNFEQEDWDGVHQEMILAMEEFTTITDILSGYSDDEINTLKRRIIGDYNRLSGNFKERLLNLTDQYTREYGNLKDDEYAKCVKSILLYMFEQCIIGKKTDYEL